MDLRATGGRVCLSEIHGSLAQGLLLYKDEIMSVEGPDASRVAPKEPPRGCTKGARFYRPEGRAFLLGVLSGGLCTRTALPRILHGASPVDERRRDDHNLLMLSELVRRPLWGTAVALPISDGECFPAANTAIGYRR